MDTPSENTLRAWISELSEPLDQAAWEKQADAWVDMLTLLSGPVGEIVNALQDGCVVAAMEVVAQNPQVLDVAEFSSRISGVFSEKETPELGLSQDWIQRLRNAKLAEDGPVWTAYRFAVRTGDRELAERCQRVSGVFDGTGSGLEGSRGLFEAWADALEGAQERKKAEAETQASATRRRQNRNKRIALYAGLASLSAVLGVGSIYLTGQSQYVESVESFENEVLSGELSAEYQAPDAIFPIEVFPELETRLQNARDARSSMNREFIALQSIVEEFVTRVKESAFGEVDVPSEAARLSEEVSELPTTLRLKLREDLGEAVTIYEEALADILGQQQHEYTALRDRFLTLRKAHDSMMTVSIVDTWLADARKLYEDTNDWKARALPDVDVDTSIVQGIEKLNTRISVLEKVVEEAQAALVDMQTPQTFEDARGALTRLAGLQSTGVRMQESVVAEASLPLWHKRLVPEKWVPLDDASVAWLERASALDSENFSYEPGTAALITALLQDASFVDVWQYFRYNYAGTQTNSLVYTQGQVVTEESLLDELREIYLVSQDLVLLEATGESAIKSTANKDGLGRYRGVVYDDGILTLESRVAKQIADLWNAEAGAFRENPLPILQTAVYDPRLSATFRAFLLQWTVDVLGVGQNYFEPTWIPELWAGAQLLKQSSAELTELTWLGDAGDAGSLSALIGSAPEHNWVESQAAVKKALLKFTEIPIQFAGLVIGDQTMLLDTNPEDALFFVLDPDRSIFVPMSPERKASNIWLPVLAATAPRLDDVGFGEFKFPAPLTFWKSLARVLPDGLADVFPVKIVE